MLVPFVLALAIAGCSGLLHNDAAPEQTYFLRAQSTAAPDGPARTLLNSSLRVVHPLADPGLQSSQIVLVQSDRRMSFYAASRWPASVPDMVEALAVQTLRASGSWKSVEDSTSPFPSDYLLQIAVRRFEADYTSGGPAPEAHVVLECTLGRREGRAVIANFVAEGSAGAAANRLGEVVAAFDNAANAALKSLAARAVEAVGADQQTKNK